MRRGTEEFHSSVPLHQDIDLLGGKEANAVVAGREELRHVLLPQLHDPLQKLLFHGNAIFVLFVKAPFEADRVLTENRTTQTSVHFLHRPKQKLSYYILR